MKKELGNDTQVSMTSQSKVWMINKKIKFFQYTQRDEKFEPMTGCQLSYDNKNLVENVFC